MLRLRAAAALLLAALAAPAARAWTWGGRAAGSTGVLVVYAGANCTGAPEAFYLSHRATAADPSCSPTLADLPCVSGPVHYANADAAAAAGASAPQWASKRDGCVAGQVSVTKALQEIEEIGDRGAVVEQGAHRPASAVYSVRSSFDPPRGLLPSIGRPSSPSHRGACGPRSLRDTEAWLAHERCSPLWTVPEARSFEVQYWVRNGCGEGWKWFKDPECTDYVGGGSYLPFGGCFDDEGSDGLVVDACASATSPPLNDPTDHDARPLLPPPKPDRPLRRRQNTAPASSATTAAPASSTATGTTGTGTATSTSSRTATGTSTATPTADAGSGLSTGAIAGIAAGGGAGAILLAGGLYMLMKKPERRPPKGLGSRPRPSDDGYALSGRPAGSGASLIPAGSASSIVGEGQLGGYGGGLERMQSTRPPYAVPQGGPPPSMAPYQMPPTTMVGGSMAPVAVVAGVQVPATNPAAPYAHMFQNGKTYTVVQAYAPTMPDELPVQPGEAVTLVEQYEDGWAFAQNSSTGGSGVLPMVTLLSPGQAGASAVMGASGAVSRDLAPPSSGTPVRTASISRRI